MILETQRLIMRPITPDDLDWLIEMRTPEPVRKYLGGERMQNPEALTKRLPFYLQCHEKFGFGFSIMSLKSTGEQIGTSGLQPLEDTGEIEVGYNLSERFWRQGLGYDSGGKASVTNARKHGFDMGLKKPGSTVSLPSLTPTTPAPGG
jgi:[ribosomal protein S5]-alanine N-acetyltransferase